MKILALIIFSFLSIGTYSQNNNVTDIFEMLLVLNKTISIEDNDSIYENSKIEKIINNIDLEIEQVESDIFEPVFFYDFKIYKFDIDKNKIIFKSDIPIVFKIGMCTEYIIIYNKKLERYYRLKGFRNNDFNSLLDDIIFYYDKNNKISKIVKELNALYYNVLDFNCLYNALKDSPKNRWKYPCMTICTDGKSAHLSR